MTFPTGPSGTPPRNSGSSGFGSPAPGFGRPGAPGGANGPHQSGSGGSPGGFGNTPPFGGQSASPSSQPFGGSAPTPPSPPQPTAYTAPQPPKGTGRFSGAIAALIALLVILAVILGVGAWFIWGRESSGSGHTAASSEPTSTATLPGTPLATSGRIDTDLEADGVVIAHTFFPDSYVSRSGSTNIADVQLTEGHNQLNAIFGFSDDRENTDVASATVTVNGADGAELASFEVPAEEALEMPINIADHQALRFTFTYKDANGNPADNTGFAVASLHAQ
ncbi:hypothetical protein HMPREF2996_09070 [Corynebacterium sp. HMSC066C02]|uniref:hypothetical protein n=1 Tax=Corynebacterium TaxID=1716 RepID=UPI0008A1E1F3|nr:MULTISPECIES: hypothetical protein [Corynebacterium]MBU5653856.1 hypothetical protein [Corynebacterium aurimucosum]OFP25618.1 hypothetical protein HMPREF2996_09070 [Corynebacterium sp. HMSC066C02]